MGGLHTFSQRCKGIQVKEPLLRINLIGVIKGNYYVPYTIHSYKNLLGMNIQGNYSQ